MKVVVLLFSLIIAVVCLFFVVTFIEHILRLDIEAIRRRYNRNLIQRMIRFKRKK